MTAPTLPPISALTGSNDPAYQVSKTVWNNGPFKIAVSQACVLGATASGDVVEVPLGANMSFSAGSLASSGSGGSANVVGDIIGGELGWSSATAFTVAAISGIDINGTVRTLSGTTYTSGSTLKNIANSTITLGTTAGYTGSKNLWVYAYYNGSALVTAVEVSGGTEDPVWDSALNYYKASNTGANARCIGQLWTDASANIIKFYTYSNGRQRTMRTASVSALVLVNNVAAVSSTSFTITPYITAFNRTFFLHPAVQSSVGSTVVVLNLSTDGGTSTIESTVVAIGATGTNHTMGTKELPYGSGTYHYSTGSSNFTASLRLCGATYRV
jgi:hypothetical protein